MNIGLQSQASRSFKWMCYIECWVYWENVYFYCYIIIVLTTINIEINCVWMYFCNFNVLLLNIVHFWLDQDVDCIMLFFIIMIFYIVTYLFVRKQYSLICNVLPTYMLVLYAMVLYCEKINLYDDTALGWKCLRHLRIFMIYMFMSAWVLFRLWIG